MVLMPNKQKLKNDSENALLSTSWSIHVEMPDDHLINSMNGKVSTSALREGLSSVNKPS